MFQKISSMFKRQNPQSNTNSFDHSKVSMSDSSKCPFMSKKMTQQSKTKQNKSNKDKKQNSDSQEEQAPRGGCPFMGTSDKKKNPGLSINKTSFDQPFVSKFKYYLSANKLDFAQIMKGGKKIKIQRQRFNKYPIYLQHTLFFQGEDFKKIRKLECCSRFLAYEQLREKGNKYFNKGQFEKSLDYYQRAMSLFRWLQYDQIKNKSNQSISLSKISSQKSIESLSENQKSKIELNLKSHHEIKKQEEINERSKEYEEMVSKYKQFFIIYHDGNVKLYDGEELEEQADIDMRKSLLIQLYLNMASTYMNLNHYSLASQIIKDALQLSDRVSQAYLRLAQSIILRKQFTLEEAYQAKTAIETAIKMKPNEKIFAPTNHNILKMLNLHDADQVYTKCSQLIDQQIKIKESKEAQLRKKIYQRAKQINQVQMNLIKEGKTPYQNLGRPCTYQTPEFKILQRMKNKYIRVIQFYTQAKNSQQVNLAKKQFQQVLRVFSETEQIFKITIQEKQDELGGINTDKIQKRIKNIKTQIANQLYNSGKYNFTVLQWAIKQIVKEEKQQQQASKKMNKGQQVAVQKKNNIWILSAMVILLPLIFIILNSYVF